MNNSRTSREEIWEWHLKIEDFLKSGLPPKAFCTSKNINYKQFTNMKYRLVYKRDSDPITYAKHVQLGQKYLASDLSASKFAKANNFEIKLLSVVGTHLRYSAVIEEMKREKEGSKLRLIQVPNAPTVQEAPQAEIVEKQNDIEINISKGVRVLIASNVDSMKIIKIIELLKDL